MSAEPETEAGKFLLNGLQAMFADSDEEGLDLILAIEAEARADCETRLAALRTAAVEMADAYRDIEGDVVSGRTDKAYSALRAALAAAGGTT